MKRFAMLIFLAATAAFFVPAAFAAAPGAIFTCQFTGQLDNIDPIVAPGVYPTAHTHRFAGGGPVEPTETSDDLRSKPTSCVTQGNHSAYWIISPTVNGVDLGPDTSKHFLAYYRCLHSASVCASMPTLPDNFGHVEGNANATSAADNPVFNNGLGGYRCGTGGGVFTTTPPASCPQSSTLVLGVTFGNCRYFDGHTDKALNSNCTSNGGVPMPRIQMYWRFQPPANGNTSLVTLDGHPTYQLHADVFFAWNQTTFTDFLNKCIRANVDCGTNPTLAP